MSSNLQTIREIIETRRKAVAERSKNFKQGPTLVERIKKMTEEELDACLKNSENTYKQFYGATIFDFLAMMPRFPRVTTDDSEPDPESKSEEPNP